MTLKWLRRQNVDTPPTKKHKHSFKAVALGAVLLVISALVIVQVLTSQRRGGTEEEAHKLQKAEKEGRSVEMTQVKQSSPERDLLLIGESRSYF
jgi:hypothetical protein